MNQFLIIEIILSILTRCDAYGSWHNRSENNHFYYHSNQTSVSWDTARDACQAKGGYLITINNDEENSFIFGLIFALPTASGWLHFIGLYRDGVVDNPELETWKWIENNQTNTYSNWPYGHPGSGLEQSRVQISPHSGKWHSLSINSIRRYICEVNDACVDTSVSCSNGHSCLTAFSTNNPCICDSDGFTGPPCGPNANFCDSNPCIHGTCSSSNSCDCQGTGYTGNTCEIEINECELNANVCGSGICEDKVNGLYCDCSNTGYTGPNCEIEINECERNPNVCGPGVCVDLDNGLTCDCAYTGYIGPNCEMKINECEQSGITCSNHGTCVDKVNGYECLCDELYTGPHCDTEIPHACVPHPCPERHIDPQSSSESLSEPTIISISVLLPLLVLSLCVIVALLFMMKRRPGRKEDVYEQPKQCEQTELDNAYAKVEANTESPYEI